MMRHVEPSCPSCSSRDLAVVVYGLPPPDVMEAVEEAKRRGRPPPFAFAGCIQGSWGEVPTWECTRCGHRFGHGKPHMGKASVS